jgi:hypothetical protein
MDSGSRIVCQCQEELRHALEIGRRHKRSGINGVFGKLDNPVVSGGAFENNSQAFLDPALARDPDFVLFGGLVAFPTLAPA